MWVSNMRVFCVVSYRGTKYYGWEKQVGQISIQEEIEKAIGQILNTPISICGSGRTDAGVHAKGQTFHFDIDDKKYDEGELMYRINCVLPASIKILSLKYLDDKQFHARFSATSKEYQYRLSLNAKNPFRYDECWMLKTNDFDIDLFKTAMSLFVGKHNFINFTSKEDDKDGFIREIFAINVGFDKENEEIIVDIKGSGFMRYQIRYMVATAVAIATHKEDLSYIQDRLTNTSKRQITSYKGHIMDSSETLYNFYQTHEKLSRLFDKLIIYSYLVHFYYFKIII